MVISKLKNGSNNFRNRKKNANIFKKKKNLK